jgi:acyl-CoA thioesterase-2
VNLADILDVAAIGPDTWRAWTPPDSGRPDIFGGQVAGQALRAATLTVPPGHLPNSVHCYFLRRGQAELPIDITVERTRAGRTYSSRRVDVRQEERTIFAMLASFHVDEPGREFDHAMPTGVPHPGSLPVPQQQGRWDPPLDMRIIPVETPAVQWWCRVADPFPDDPALHFCGLLYASDLRAGGAAMAAVGFPTGMEPPGEGAERPALAGNFGSLDHAVWFHRPPVVNEWFFCDVRPLTVRDSRGLVLGRMFDQEARHIATFAQEMFLKEVGPGLN